MSQFFGELAHRSGLHAHIEAGRGKNLTQLVEQATDDALLAGGKPARQTVMHLHRAGETAGKQRHGLQGRGHNILRINADIAEGALIQRQHIQRGHRGDLLVLELKPQHLRRSHGDGLLERSLVQQIGIPFRNAEILLLRELLQLFPHLAERIQVDEPLSGVAQNPAVHHLITGGYLAEPFLAG